MYATSSVLVRYVQSASLILSSGLRSYRRFHLRGKEVQENEIAGRADVWTTWEEGHAGDLFCLLAVEAGPSMFTTKAKATDVPVEARLLGARQVSRWKG